MKGRSLTGAGWYSWMRGCRKFRTIANASGFRSTRPWNWLSACACRRRGMRCLPSTLLRSPCHTFLVSSFAKKLLPTIAERIQDYWAQNNSDWVMYRKALAAAAEARGWPVHWYDAKKVLGEASRALWVENFDAHFFQVRKAVGPLGTTITSSPWRQLSSRETRCFRVPLSHHPAPQDEAAQDE